MYMQMQSCVAVGLPAIQWHLFCSHCEGVYTMTVKPLHCRMNRVSSCKLELLYIQWPLCTEHTWIKQPYTRRGSQQLWFSERTCLLVVGGLVNVPQLPVVVSECTAPACQWMWFRERTCSVDRQQSVAVVTIWKTPSARVQGQRLHGAPRQRVAVLWNP